MSLPALAIEKRPITLFLTFLIVVGGLFCYQQLGQLEDPEFSVKTAAIVTAYPGASPEQVELEVTDLLETRLQEMKEIKNIYSTSRAGLSIIKVDIKDQYWSDKLPQVWDILRNKVHDVSRLLPPGAAAPDVIDDFGHVFGFLLAVTSDGYSEAELEQYVKNLRKELSLIPGVARVNLWGARNKRIYINISEPQLSQLGLTVEELVSTLRTQNMVVDAGAVDYQTLRMRVAPTGEFASPDAIAELAVTNLASAQPGSSRRNEIIRIKDFATVTFGYDDPPSNLLRQNGRMAIALAIAPGSGVNVVKVGRLIDARLNELIADLPVGIGVEKISWQSDSVSDSIRLFMVSMIEAVAIVLLVLALTMGFRVGAIIGISGLIFPILGTFIVMWLMKIDLQRVSLGAMIVAMGMMVDNAIVVADGIVVRLRQGMDRNKDAVEAARQPALALLGATIVACMAFYPIFASNYSTGEYAGSLFTVVAISLLLSWLFSQTITPILTLAWLPMPKAEADPFRTPFYAKFRNLLRWVIGRRFAFMGGLILLLLLSVGGFRFVPQIYFPDSSRKQIMIDYWAPEGTRIQQVSADLEKIENKLMADESVVGVSAFIGQGPPRFYLPVSPEDVCSSYAQIVVNTKTLRDVDKLMAQLNPWLKENVPEAVVRVRKYAVGAFDDWKFEVRFSGPANADPDTLRRLGQQGMDILHATPYAKEVRTNWRNRVQKIVPKYNQERGRWAGVSREDLAKATKRAYDGVVVGQYRQKDDLIPILLRNTQAERQFAATALENVQILPPLSSNPVPVAQVVDRVKTEWEDPIISRWDRRRAISVQCSPNGVTAPTLMQNVQNAFEQIELPPGYQMEWDGEYKSSKESQEYLVPGIIPAVVIMVLILVVLFNAYRPPLIVFSVLPFVMIGITFGLLITQVPFGFIALLGAMSLSGMMIKNAVVLLDQVNQNLSDGLAPYDAVVEAAVSRLRPVVNAAATTVFGMIPLLQDVFWVSMSITIMFGLACGTALTMIVVPALYATLYRIAVPQKK